MKNMPAKTLAQSHDLGDKKNILVSPQTFKATHLKKN